MSQLILDDQLDLHRVVRPIQAWVTATRLQDLRPGEHILDDRVPEILGTINRPTFVTVDQGFWDRLLCHPDYCIVYVALRTDEQSELPLLLRKMLRLEIFRTRSCRMGKVIRVAANSVDYWEHPAKTLLHVNWGSR